MNTKVASVPFASVAAREQMTLQKHANDELCRYSAPQRRFCLVVMPINDYKLRCRYLTNCTLSSKTIAKILHTSADAWATEFLRICSQQCTSVAWASCNLKADSICLYATARQLSIASASAQACSSSRRRLNSAYAF